MVFTKIKIFPQVFLLALLFLDSCANIIDIDIASPQSSILSYVATRPLQSPQELLDRNIFNWAIGTIQPFTLFDNSLFRQIWNDLPGVFCKYGSSSFPAVLTKNSLRLAHN